MALLGLKCALRLAATATLWPDRGLRLVRAARSRIANVPKARSSTRSPSASAGHPVEDGSHHTLNVLGVEVWVLRRDAGDELGSDHAAPMPRRSTNRDRTAARERFSNHPT